MGRFVCKTGQSVGETTRAATHHYLFLSCKLSMRVENVHGFFFIDTPCKSVLKYVRFPLLLTCLQQAHILLHDLLSMAHDASYWHVWRHNHQPLCTCWNSTRSFVYNQQILRLWVKTAPSHLSQNNLFIWCECTYRKITYTAFYLYLSSAWMSYYI